MGYARKIDHEIWLNNFRFPPNASIGQIFDLILLANTGMGYLREDLAG